jgi:hypothetical protein
MFAVVEDCCIASSTVSGIKHDMRAPPADFNLSRVVRRLAHYLLTRVELGSVCSSPLRRRRNPMKGL